MGKQVEKVRIGPINWLETATLIAMVLEQGTDKGKEVARDELIKMAKAADLAGEMLTALKMIESCLAPEDNDEAARAVRAAINRARKAFV